MTTHRDKNRPYALVLSLLLLSTLIASNPDVPQSAGRSGADEIESVGGRISPAGSLVIDTTTRQPAVGALTVDFVRSPDRTGRDGKGRYLIAVNSGFGVQFNAASNRGQQSLAVIDLNAKPAPAVVQNVYFPSPQSVNVGVVFAPTADQDGSYPLYVSGGFENKIWIFQFFPGSATPIVPSSPGPNTSVEAPFIDVSGFATTAPSPRYNSERAPVYTTGIAIAPDGSTLFVANNLGDSLGIVSDLRGERRLTQVDLHRPSNPKQFMYPYAVVTSTGADSYKPAGQPGVEPGRSSLKVYVSCWNDASIAVVDIGNLTRPVSFIAVGRHPTAMLLNPERTRLFVVNSNHDSVSVIDTAIDKEIERIDVRLSEKFPPGNSPESLALDGDSLYVANAHSNSLATIKLSRRAAGGLYAGSTAEERERRNREEQTGRSTVRGFIPTGLYPSAVAIVDHTIFVGNGKGSGVENSSVIVNNSGWTPNAPNDRFPAGNGRGTGQGGQYSVSLVVGNISALPEPDNPTLLRYTQQVMRNNGLLGIQQTKLFAGPSPIKHVIYVIKENRTYDQVFGDLQQAGNGERADGDARLAIFGAGDAAQRRQGVSQDVTPNHRALALRFGLLDRFFVNSEASPDGHNWSTAAFSNDYVDKAFRWGYSRRGRGYDYEGFNRLPNYEPVRGSPSLFGPSAAVEDVANFMRRFIPYLNGSRDVAEPETLYLWDAAARAGLTYRNYGEFVATLSEADVDAIRKNRAKSYPDVSPTVSAFPTKRVLEGHYNSSFRNFDMDTPDAMTVESYRNARESGRGNSALVSNAHTDSRFRGVSRLGVWLEEFRTLASEREAGKPDRMPNLSILRFPNDHTDGLRAGRPTPQFFVADNDYALGKLVEAVSNSPYWKDTALLVVEDDAQDGPDHVDAHRSVALVISAYNRPGLLIHEFHNTVSLIRTLELLLGIRPMNQLDATATPINIFRTEPDLRPYEALLPNINLDNLITQPARDATTANWMKRTTELDMSHADMADPLTLNLILWHSVRGTEPMPPVSRLPIFDAFRLGLQEKRDQLAHAQSTDRDE